VEGVCGDTSWTKENCSSIGMLARKTFLLTFSLTCLSSTAAFNLMPLTTDDTDVVALTWSDVNCLDGQNSTMGLKGLGQAFWLEVLSFPNLELIWWWCAAWWDHWTYQTGQGIGVGMCTCHLDCTVKVNDSLVLCGVNECANWSDNEFLVFWKLSWVVWVGEEYGCFGSSKGMATLHCLDWL